MIASALAVAKHAPAYETLPLPEVRRRAKQGYVYAENTKVLDVEELAVPGPDGDINVRIYRPFDQGVLPALVFFHGSGFCILDLDTHDEICRSLCFNANCVVLSVDYALAPEARYPRGIDDSFNATAWIMENAASLGIDEGKVVLSGDSAGGNMATVTAMRMRDEGRVLPAGLLLFYPVTEHYDAQHRSYESFGTGFGLSANTMRWFWGLYLGEYPDTNCWSISPARGSLRNLPPTYVQTAEFDVLRDEGEQFVRRLQQDLVPVKWKRADGLNHGYLRWMGAIDEATIKMLEACEWLSRLWSRDQGNPTAETTGKAAS